MKIKITNTAKGALAFSLPITGEPIDLNPGDRATIIDPNASAILKSPVLLGWEASGKVRIDRIEEAEKTEGPTDEAAMHAAVANATAAAASSETVDGQTPPPKGSRVKSRKTAQG